MKISLRGAFLIILIVFLTAFSLTFQSAIDVGVSMYPTCADGDMLLVRKLYREDTINRGDIVYLNLDPAEYPALGNATKLLKRVVAVAGDEVRVDKTGFYVNGVLQREGYTSLPTWYEDGTIYGVWQISEGKIFVMGDNRPYSYDSRNFGEVSEESVVGKLFLNLTEKTGVTNLTYRVLVCVLGSALFILIFYKYLIKGDKKNVKV